MACDALCGWADDAGDVTQLMLPLVTSAVPNCMSVYSTHRTSNNTRTTDVINVYHFFIQVTFFYVFNAFSTFFFNFKKRCQMQSMNMEKSNEKYS